MFEISGKLHYSAESDADQRAPNRFSPLYREVRQTTGKTVRSVFCTAFARSASPEYFHALLFGRLVAPDQVARAHYRNF